MNIPKVYNGILFFFRQFSKILTGNSNEDAPFNSYITFSPTENLNQGNVKLSILIYINKFN